MIACVHNYFDEDKVCYLLRAPAFGDRRHGAGDAMGGKTGR